MIIYKFKAQIKSFFDLINNFSSQLFLNIPMHKDKNKIKHCQCYHVKQLTSSSNQQSKISEEYITKKLLSFLNTQTQQMLSVNKKQISKQQTNQLQSIIKYNYELALKKKHKFFPKLFEKAQYSDMILNLFQNQLILTQISPYATKLQQLKKNKQVFRDQRFPPTQQSLTGQYGIIKQWERFKWQKISDIIENPQIFVDEIEPHDIRQGDLSDCYFLAGLAALAQVPRRITDLFIFSEMNNQKYLSVKMLYKGKWMIIDMDEYIPVNQNRKPAFSKARKKQLWVILLQKAWAKLYTSYKRIEFGYPQQVLHDLTGAPIVEKYLQNNQNYIFNQSETWDYLVKASEKFYAMVATSQPIKKNESQIEIVQSHSYTFLKAVQLQYLGKKEKIVQLRNPFGLMQPCSQWDDHDQKWCNVSPQQKKKIGHTGNKEDGFFFMGWNDFCEQFHSVTVAQINDCASYTYLSHKDPEVEGCFFKIEIFEFGQYCLQIDNTPQRSFIQYSDQKQFQYPQIRMSIACLSEKDIIKKQVVSINKRTLFYKQNFEKGIYIVEVQIDFKRYQQKNFDVNLAVYGDKICVIQLATNQEARLLRGQQVNWNGMATIQNQSSWNTLGNLNWEIRAKSQQNHNDIKPSQITTEYQKILHRLISNPENIQQSKQKNYKSSFDRIIRQKNRFISERNNKSLSMTSATKSTNIKQMKQLDN